MPGSTVNLCVAGDLFSRRVGDRNRHKVNVGIEGLGPSEDGDTREPLFV